MMQRYMRDIRRMAEDIHPGAKLVKTKSGLRIVLPTGRFVVALINIKDGHHGLKNLRATLLHEVRT